MSQTDTLISIEFEQGGDWLQQVAPLSMRHFRIEKKQLPKPKAEVKTANEPRTKNLLFFIIYIMLCWTGILILVYLKTPA